MADLILLFGKILLLGLLYLFLFAAVRAGIGLVSTGVPARDATLRVRVTRGPRELLGMKLPLTAVLTVGRSPEADIVVADEFASSMHTRLTPARGGVLVEDLGSTNGTLLNGQPLIGPETAGPGDVVGVGTVELTLELA